MTTAAKTDFSQGKIPRVIMRMAIPMTVAQIVNVLYSLIDRMYIGRLSDSLAFTGLGLSLPAVTLVMGFANLFGTGGAPLFSIARGKEDTIEAQRVQGNTFSLLVLTGALVTVLGLIFLRPILYLFGASDATWPYARDYLSIYLCGTVFVMISLGMNGFINAQGFARTGMLTVVIGAVVNLVLDPIFIFTLDMGVKGAAIATVIAQGCSALWVMFFLLGKRALLRLALRDLRLQAQRVRQIVSLGITGFVMSATTALVQIVANVQLRAFGGDLYVGIMTALNSVHEMAVMFSRGLTQGAQPVLGFNYGAGLSDRVRQSIRFISVTGILYGVVIWGALMLLPEQIIRLFLREEAIVQPAIRALRLYFVGFFLISLQFVGQSVFVGLGKSRPAIFFSMLRKVVIVSVLMLILPNLWGLGVNGVFLAEPISCLLGGGACYLTMCLTVYRKLATPVGSADAS